NPLGSPNNNFIIGAGSNRLLLVAVSCLSNNISDFGQNFSATYGGRLLTQAARQNSINRQTWIGYLKEADIVLRSDNVVNVTVDGVHTEVVAFIASYQNVNQANPVATSGGNSWPILNYDGGYRTAVNTTPLQVGPGGYAIYNWSSVLLTRISDSENYTENADYLHSSGIASKPFPSAANTKPTVSWSYYATGGGTDRSGSSSGITLNSYAGTVAFAMSTSTYSVKENVGEATITVQRLGSASGAVSVHYAASSGIYWTLAGIDFTPVSGDLSWGDGEMTPKTFTVPIMDNQLANYDKLVNVTLTDPTGAILGVPNTAVLTIVNDESTIAFTASTYSVNENGGEVVITASRANSATEAVSVNYATIAGGTAIPGTEYLPVSGTLNWAPGDVANKTFSIVINDNTEYQGDKTIYLALTNPTGGALLGTSNMAVLTIAEDESGVCFSAGTYTIKEDGGAATITVNRHGTSTGPVSVDYLATGDTAAAGIDF
ncbi:MAG: Calx-beta domain-containing protein, partial [Desulfobulbaceae bacterium]|nr:Calx-beta domain-containing protein [Desulfobulbaceae bacterium]